MTTQELREALDATDKLIKDLKLQQKELDETLRNVVEERLDLWHEYIRRGGEVDFG